MRALLMLMLACMSALESVFYNLFFCNSKNFTHFMGKITRQTNIMVKFHEHRFFDLANAIQTIVFVQDLTN